MRRHRLVSGSSVPRFRSLVFPDFHRTAERRRRWLRDSRTVALFAADRTRSAEDFGDLVASGRVQRSSHDRRMEVGNLWDFRRDISRQGDLRSTGGPI